MIAKKCILSFFILLTALKSIEAVLTPEDEDFFGHTADRYDWSKHPCRRKCSKYEKPKKCHYVFVVEKFSTMSKACYDCPFNVTDCFRPHCIAADGVQKQIYVVNRQLPGPLVEVCEDDLIVVDVRNQMLSEATTIHWHGFKQKKTPYMDGVPYVTQCPILPGQTFTYTFNATSMGTFFWHSHMGSQRADGFFGPLIVNRRDVKGKILYDYDEHRMIINDWGHSAADAGLTRMYHYKSDVSPTMILVNGRGRFQEFDKNGSVRYTPVAVFEVKRNKKYRFRLINAGAEDCPIEMSIDNHTTIVTSLDSNDIVATEVNWITIWQGERVDFILRTNQKPDNYWIRYRGYGQCRNNETDGVYQVAILRYKEVELNEPKGRVAYELPIATNKTRVLNAYNTGTESPKSVVNIPNLTALDANDESLNEKVDHQIYLSFDFYNIDNYDFHRKDLYGYNQVPSDRSIGTLQINHISLKLPEFPLLSQWQLLKPNSFCNASHVPDHKNCTTEQCACTHVIRVGLDSVVEVILIDQGEGAAAVNHPFHIHGHFFRVVAEENLEGVVTVDRVKQLDKEGKIKRRLNHPPMKDTMKTPGGGYTVIRFHANNPGYWFFHCHFDQHSNVGMALVFKVGEHKDFPKKPKGFPKCGNFKPGKTC